MPEGEQAREVRRRGLSYLRAHWHRLPIVLPARQARAWGLWDPRDQVRRDVTETRSEGFQWLVWATNHATLAAGVTGIVLLRRRGRELVVLLGPIAVVVLTALLAYGNPRFRTMAEPALLIAAGALIVRAWDRWRTTRRTIMFDG